MGEPGKNDVALVAGIFADETPEYEYLIDFDISLELAVTRYQQSKSNTFESYCTETGEIFLGALLRGSPAF